MSDRVIYLAEDDLDDRRLIVEAITRNDNSIQIFNADNGLELLALLSDQTIPRATLIIIDLNMPKMNGFEAIKIIKANAGMLHIPLVMMTTSSESIDLQFAYDNGIELFYTKPTDYKSLDSFVDFLLRRYMA